MLVVGLALLARGLSTVTGNTPEWHRLGLGKLDNIEPYKDQYILSGEGCVAKVDSNGEIVWKQYAHYPTKLAVGEHAYTLEGDILNAYNLTSGAKEWSVAADSFAVTAEGVAVEREDRYSLLGSATWTPLNGKHIYGCNGSLQLEPCPDATIELRVDPKTLETSAWQNGTILWLRHEALAYPKSSCFVSPPKKPYDQVSGLLKNWRRRVSAHARLSWFEHEDPYDGLLVVVTELGSLYALDSKSGSVVWTAYDDRLLVPNLRLAGDGSSIVATSSHERLVFDYYGILISAVPIAGYTVQFDEARVYGVLDGSETWQLEFDTVREVKFHPSGPIASLGHYIGPKDFLYKYINPNLIAVSTDSFLHLIDGVSGKEIAQHKGQVEAVVVGEYWVAFTENNRLYLWDLFESADPNTRILTNVSAFDDPTVVPYVVETTLETNWDLLSVSKTRNGIAAQCILGADVAAGQLYASPHDRPNKPILLSKEYYVDGLKMVNAFPLKYESTFAVAGLGTDILFTTYSPSGSFDQLPKEFSFVSIIVSLFIMTYVAYQLATSYLQDRLQVVWS